eukprot:6209223-Pleurochrysis_carterae.AAC.6
MASFAKRFFWRTAPIEQCTRASAEQGEKHRRCRHRYSLRDRRTSKRSASSGADSTSTWKGTIAVLAHDSALAS